jgi:hypothetical protein
MLALSAPPAAASAPSLLFVGIIPIRV